MSKNLVQGLVIAALVASLGSSLALPAAAQQPAAPPAAADSPELAALEEKAAILEQELKILETENKLIAERFGTPATPLEGKVETEGDVPIEAQVLAYGVVESAAKAIVEAIETTTTGKPVVIYDSAQVAAVQSYVAFLKRLDLLTQEYDRAISKADPAAPELVAPAIVAGLASSVLEVLGLFRTDVKVISKSLTLDELALIAAVSDYLRLHSDVYHPALVPPDFAVLPTKNESPLLEKLDTLNGRRQRVDALLKQLTAGIGGKQKEIAGLDKEIAEIAKKIKAGTGNIPALEKSLAEKKELKETAQGRLAELTAAKKGLEAVTAIHETIRTALVSGGGAGATPAMLGLLSAERVRKLLENAGAHLLDLEIVAAGGTTQTTRNLFVGGKLRHSGGAVVTYLLFGSDGRILRSGNVSGRSPAVRFKNW